MVRLNIDLGELPDEPGALYRAAHLANVACGGHAGDEASMRRAVRACGALGVAIGAHPSYEDRPGFGRARQDVSSSTLRLQVARQCGALAEIAASEHLMVRFVKPHGALYHACDLESDVAAAVLDGVGDALQAATIIGPPGLIRAAEARGWLGWRERFADRGLRDDGSLVPRGEPGALLDVDGAATQTRRLLARGGFETLCVHGDGPHAAEIARIVRAILDE